MKEDKLFSVRIHSIKSDAPIGDIAEFLSTVFKTKTPEDVAIALNDLPLTVVSGIDKKSATLLSSYLENFGAEVVIEELENKKITETKNTEEQEFIEEPIRSDSTVSLVSEKTSIPSVPASDQEIKKIESISKKDPTYYIIHKPVKEEIFPSSHTRTGRVFRKNELNTRSEDGMKPTDNTINELEKDRLSKEMEFRIAPGPEENGKDSSNIESRVVEKPTIQKGKKNGFLGKIIRKKNKLEAKK